MKILFIADLNLGNNPQGGGQFKSRMLQRVYQEIPKVEFQVIDTTGYKKNFAILFKLFYLVLFRQFDHIILSTSTKSADLFLHIIYFLKRSVLSKVIYNPQGMFIEQALLNGFYNIKKYKSLNIFYFESKRAVDVFCGMGLNAKYYSNGKYFELDKGYLKLKEAPFKTLNLVFISRICEEKGVLLIFDALEKLRNRMNGVTVSVDFYGPIAKDFKETFESQLIENTHYCGYLDMLNDVESSYRKLSSYDAMILPTHWKGEGIAGVFIDAFISGLPILTTAWGVNEEIVTNDLNGWIVPPIDSDSLAEKLIEITGDFDKLNQMKIAAFEKRRDFHITKIQQTLINDVSIN